jgi:hypothetical protein
MKSDMKFADPSRLCQWQSRLLCFNLFVAMLRIRWCGQAVIGQIDTLPKLRSRLANADIEVQDIFPRAEFGI